MFLLLKLLRSTIRHQGERNVMQMTFLKQKAINNERKWLTKHF